MRLVTTLAMLVAASLTGTSAVPQVLPTKEPIVFFWAEDVESEERTPLGSGFILGPNGDVLTAKHVIENENVVQGVRLVVSISTKSQFPVQVDMADVDCSNNQDFCFVRIPSNVIDPEKMTDFYKVGCYLPGEGESLIAAGFFAGDDRNTGVVTPRGDVIGDVITGGLLPTDVAMEAGMSGGPVFDSKGVVIGLVRGGSDQFAYVQPLQRARGFLEARSIDCLSSPPDEGFLEDAANETLRRLDQTLSLLGTVGDYEGPSAGGTVGQIDHGSITCPPGQYLSGLHFYGATEGVRYCVGCFTGATAICRPLN